MEVIALQAPSIDSHSLASSHVAISLAILVDLRKGADVPALVTNKVIMLDGLLHVSVTDTETHLRNLVAGFLITS